MRMQKEITFMFRHPFGFIIGCFLVSVIFYGIAQVFSSNTYSIELVTNSIFLFGCLTGVIIAFRGKRGLLCKGITVSVAIVCWVFIFRGYLFSFYYQKNLESWSNEQQILGDQQWERKRNEAHRPKEETE
jgi:hypothetical protein